MTYLKEHEAEMFQGLRDMVLIQSGSENKKGVDQVGRLIRDRLSSTSMSFSAMKQKTYGDHLIFRSHRKEDFQKGILITGHMDTVFPEDTLFNQYHEDNLKCYGPGVIDMKGGLVAGIYALKALDFFGYLAKIPISFIVNSDEEIGSRTSGDLIRREARQSVFAFVLEGGGLNNEVVTGRKGNISVKLETYGKAGHAAFVSKNKASAILELAQKIIAFESLNDPDKGITANVGRIEGGTRPNSVPEHAVARIDFRFETIVSGDFLKRRIDQIVLENFVPGTKSKYWIITERPPMPANHTNKELYESVAGTAEALGISISEEFRAGVSDANIIADEKTAVIDGLGPIGAMDHSENEYMIKKSLLERTLLLTFSIIDCWERYEEK